MCVKARVSSPSFPYTIAPLTDTLANATSFFAGTRNARNRSCVVTLLRKINNLRLFRLASVCLSASAALLKTVKD